MSETQDQPTREQELIAATRMIIRARWSQPRWAGPLARVGLAAVATAVVAIGILHFVRPSRELDPLTRTISEYALLSDGWVFVAGVAVLSIGSAAILWALILRDLVPWRSWGAIMIAVWCLGLIGLLVFPKQGFGPDPSVAGRVHWTWTLIAFFSLPVGCFVTCWRHRFLVAGPRWPRWASRLSLAAAGWFALLTLQTVLSATTRLHAWQFVGLIERGLALTEMATVAMLGGWVLAVVRLEHRIPRRKPKEAETVSAMTEELPGR